MLWMRRLFVRTPKIGDKVWWASKQVGLVVAEVGPTRFVAVGGEIVRARRSGRQVPRWTLTTPHRTTLWHEQLGMWIVGQGKYPRVPRGTQVIRPDPVHAEGDVLKNIVREEN